LDPLTAFKAEYVAARAAVSRARGLASELVRRYDLAAARSGSGSDGPRGFSGRDPSAAPGGATTGGRGASHAVAAYLSRLQTLSGQFESYFLRITPLLAVARQPSAFVADR